MLLRGIKIVLKTPIGAFLTIVSILLAMVVGLLTTRIMMQANRIAELQAELSGRQTQLLELESLPILDIVAERVWREELQVLPNDDSTSSSRSKMRPYDWQLHIENSGSRVRDINITAQSYLFMAENCALSEFVSVFIPIYYLSSASYSSNRVGEIATLYWSPFPEVAINTPESEESRQEPAVIKFLHETPSCKDRNIAFGCLMIRCADSLPGFSITLWTHITISYIDLLAELHQESFLFLDELYEDPQIWWVTGQTFEDILDPCRLGYLPGNTVAVADLRESLSLSRFEELVWQISSRPGFAEQKSVLMIEKLIPEDLVDIWKHYNPHLSDLDIAILFEIPNFLKNQIIIEEE